MKKAALFEESSVDTGPDKMLAWGKKDGLSILQRERKEKQTGGAASGQGVSGISAGPRKEQGQSVPKLLLVLCCPQAQRTGLISQGHLLEECLLY